MGGPMKSSIDKNKVFVQENVAGKAVNRGTKHPRQSKLDWRIGGWEKMTRDHKSKTELHKPGSQNAHK